MMVLIAGLAEVAWALAMGMSDGFRNIGYTMIFVVFLIISTYLLSKSLDEGLPVGSAYAVWVGIGAIGTVLISYLVGMEDLSMGSLFFLALVAIGVIGLQATGGGHVEVGED